MVKNTEKTKRVKRTNDEIALDKANRGFGQIETANRKLISAKHNIIKAKNQEMANRFNTALDNFAETLSHMKIVDSDFETVDSPKETRKAFDLNAVSTETPESD